MGAIKAILPARAITQATKTQPISGVSAPLARKLTRPLSPSELAGFLAETKGVPVSVSWVHKRIKRGEIATVRVLYYSRRLIPVSEAYRIADGLKEANS